MPEAVAPVARRRGASVVDLLVRHHELLVPAVLVLALAIRIAIVLDSSHSALLFDSGDYDRHARSIADGHGFPGTVFAAGGGPSAFRPPLYPYLLGGVYALVGNGSGPDAGRVLGALLGTLAVFLIWLIARELWGKVVAAIAAVIAAIFPPLIVLNASLLSEPLFIVIELAMVLAVFAARRRESWRWAAIAGALCGLGALTRSNGSLLVILAMWGVWTVRPRLSRQALLAPAAALVAMILVIVPWTVRNAFTFHRFVPITTQSGFALAGVFNDGARTFPSYPGTWVLPEVQTRYAHMYQDRSLNEVRLDQKQRSSALSYAIHHIPYAAEEVGLNFLRILSLAPSARLANHADDLQLGVKPHWVQPLKWSWFVLGAIAIGGIVVLLRAPPSRRGPPWFWTIPVLMVLVAAAVIGSHRYRVPAYPFAIFLAAIALNQVGIMVGLLQSSSEAVVGA